MLSVQGQYDNSYQMFNKLLYSGILHPPQEDAPLRHSTASPPPLHAHVVRLRGTDDHGINFQSSDWCWKTHSQWESVNHSISSTSINLTLQWLQR